jgi:hypothetical protein
LSRLDSFIRRLEAQRACLDRALFLSSELKGVIVELGLGNGRTYDHLRASDRRIYALDRELAAHPDCVPEDLLLGEFRDTLPKLRRRIGRSVALVHADTGSGDATASLANARALPGLLEPLLVEGAIVVSDQDMVSGWTALPLPEGVSPGRYFIWRCSSNHSPA